MGRAFGAILVLYAMVTVALSRFDAWCWRKAAKSLLWVAYRSGRRALDKTNTAREKEWGLYA